MSVFRYLLVAGLLILAAILLFYLFSRPGPAPAGGDAEPVPGGSDSVLHSPDDSDRRQSLPPGTARVRMVITETGGEEGSVWLQARIEQVLGYGAAAGVLGAGETVRVGASGFLETAGQDTASLPLNEPVTALLKQAGGMDRTDTADVHWELSGLEEH